MPKRAAVAMIGDSEWRSIRDSRFSARLTTATALGAQTEASAQFGAGDSVWATVLVGIAPCSGTWHSALLARSERPRQAAVPKRGCSWSRRSRAAKVAFIGLNATGSHPQQQEGCGPLDPQATLILRYRAFTSS
jgi:hypothetical protein